MSNYTEAINLAKSQAKLFQRDQTVEFLDGEFYTYPAHLLGREPKSVYKLCAIVHPDGHAAELAFDRESMIEGVLA